MINELKPYSVQDVPSEDVENMKLFWKFVVEREMIRKKRHVLKLPKPWTHDPILQKHRFTNIYRDQDRGTRFYTEVVVPGSKNEQDIFFRTILYRIFNRIDTFKEIPDGLAHVKTFDPDKVYNILKAKEKKDGKTVFTDAFMVTGIKFYGHHSKIYNYLKVIEKIGCNKGIFLSIYQNKSSMPKIWKILQKQQGIGGFLAQQIAVDFSYTQLVKYTDDEWTHAGPGAKRGLEYIFPGGKNHFQEMRFLRDNQIYFMSNLDLFDQFTKHGHRLISLNNIENCLCEFSKYMRFKDGTMRKKRYFQASEIPLP